MRPRAVSFPEQIKANYSGLLDVLVGGLDIAIVELTCAVSLFQ